MTADATKVGVERRLHPMYLVFAFFSTIRGFAVPLVVLLLLRRGDIDSLALLFIVPSVLFALLRYLSLRYSLGDHELRVRGGLLFRFERHIPYHRIQNLKLHRSLFHRLFGLTGLTIETASGEEVEAKLDVLSLKDLKFIEARISQADRSSPRLEADETRDALPVDDPSHQLKLGLVDVLLAGLASNRGLTLILAGLGFLWEQIGNERIIAELSMLSNLVQVLGLPSAYTSGLGLMLSVPILLILLLVMTRVLSMVWSVLRYGRFNLQLEGTELRLRQGIFTEVASTIPRSRIQMVTLKRSALNRFMGRVEVLFSTAGGADGDDAALRSIPSLEVSRLPRALTMIQPEATDAIDASTAALPKCWRSLFFRALLPALVLVPVALRFTRIDSRLILAVGLLYLPLAYFLARRRIKVMAIGISERDIIVTRGWPTFSARRLPYAKLQSVAVSESPFDRRRGTVSIELDYAGAGFGKAGVKVEFVERQSALALAQTIGERAATAGFVWA